MYIPCGSMWVWLLAFNMVCSILIHSRCYVHFHGVNKPPFIYPFYTGRHWIVWIFVVRFFFLYVVVVCICRLIWHTFKQYCFSLYILWNITFMIAFCYYACTTMNILTCVFGAYIQVSLGHTPGNYWVVEIYLFVFPVYMFAFALAVTAF